MQAHLFKDYFENDRSVSYFCLHTKYVLQDCILRLISFGENTKKTSVWQFGEQWETKGQKNQKPICKKKDICRVPNYEAWLCSE